MIKYRLGLMPIIPFSLAGFPNIKTMLMIGLIVFAFMFLSIFINNNLLEKIFVKEKSK